MNGSERVAFYSEALVDAGYGAQELSPSGLFKAGRRPLTMTHDAFEVFARLRAAPEVLALVEIFSEQSALREYSDFSVSCLPSTGSSRGSSRACTVSVGMVEVFVVVIDHSTGGVSSVFIWAEPDDELRWLDDESSIDIDRSDHDGGAITLGLPGDIAQDLLAEPEIGEVVSRRVAGIRGRRRRTRRDDWHNRWLWALVDSGVASPPVNEPIAESVLDVSSPDVRRWARQRTSQQRFRALLLRTQPNECAICGITLLDVLEAAHLDPHARGGAASVENGRLLCANHHSAYDARLYKWTGTEFIWDRPESEPQLGGVGP